MVLQVVLAPVDRGAQARLVPRGQVVRAVPGHRALRARAHLGHRAQDQVDRRAQVAAAVRRVQVDLLDLGLPGQVVPVDLVHQDHLRDLVVAPDRAALDLVDQDPAADHQAVPDQVVLRVLVLLVAQDRAGQVLVGRAPAAQAQAVQDQVDLAAQAVLVHQAPAAAAVRLDQVDLRAAVVALVITHGTASSGSPWTSSILVLPPSPVGHNQFAFVLDLSLLHPAHSLAKLSTQDASNAQRLGLLLQTRWALPNI